MTILTIVILYDFYHIKSCATSAFLNLTLAFGDWGLYVVRKPESPRETTYGTHGQQSDCAQWPYVWWEKTSKQFQLTAIWGFPGEILDTIGAEENHSAGTLWLYTMAVILWCRVWSILLPGYKYLEVSFCGGEGKNTRRCFVRMNYLWRVHKKLATVATSQGGDLVIRRREGEILPFHFCTSCNTCSCDPKEIKCKSTGKEETKLFLLAEQAGQVIVWGECSPSFGPSHNQVENAATTIHHWWFVFLQTAL